MDRLEVTKTQGNVTIKHDSQYYDYVQNRIQLNEFLKEDKMREGNLTLSREDAQQALIEKYGFEASKEEEVHVEQKELSWKERQKQKIAHKALLKKTRKRYPMGTEDTLNIVSQHNEQVAIRNTKMANFRKPSDKLSEDSKKRILLVGELDSYMDATIRAVALEPSVRLGEMIKKYDGSFINKLTPEYIRRNYAEVKQEMDKINCIAKNIEMGDVEPTILHKENEISWMTGVPYNFVEFAKECKVLYNKALVTYGLKVNEDNGELVASKKEDQNILKLQYGSSLYKLKKMFSEKKDKSDIENDIMKYQDFLVKTEQEMERRHAANEDTTQIESLLFKARYEIDIIKAIRDNYDNPETLTEEERQYANMYYDIKDEAYKEDKKNKITLLRDIENFMKDGTSDIENVKEEINVLADRLHSDMSVEELDEYRTEVYSVVTSIFKDGVATYSDTAINALKVSKIIYFANKLRATDILSGIRSDSITLDDLTEQERNSIINNTDGEVTELDIAEYAKKICITAEKQYEMAINGYMLSRDAAEMYDQIGINKYKKREIADKSNHKNVSTKIIEYAKEYIIGNKDMELEYNKLKNGEYKDMSSEEIAERMTYIPIIYRLKSKKYSVYGDKDAPYVAPIFRSMSVYEYVEFADMSDEEFLNMAKKLSAGTFEKDVDEDTKAQYAKDNMEGLKILKEKSIARYKSLYEKYGFRIIDVDYIQEHYDEIGKDFSFTQDNEQQYAIKGVLNESSDNDMLLFHLMKFYSDISYIAIGVLKTSITVGYNDYKEKIKEKWNESTNEHYTYLKEHEGDILKL